MLNTRDEQHTLSQPTRRRANTANGKEGLKHASTLFCMYLSVEACLSPSLPFAVFALRLVGCDFYFYFWN